MELDPKVVARRGQSLAQGFARFLLRGKVVDLAIAVVIGAAAGSLITSFVKDIFAPAIAMIFGTHEFEKATLTIRGSTISYGSFINSLLSFLIIAGVVYLFVITPTNRLENNAYFQPPSDPNFRKCPECLGEIPKDARRCMFCTQLVGALEE